MNTNKYAKFKTMYVKLKALRTTAHKPFDLSLVNENRRRRTEWEITQFGYELEYLKKEIKKFFNDCTFNEKIEYLLKVKKDLNEKI
jgi:hypothetical protein